MGFSTSMSIPRSFAAGVHPCALLVDRDADTRHMYAEFLRQSACEIDEAEDGREALAKAIARHPDVIVTETRLSGISGIDLCRLLRTDPATSDIPIVVVTGDAFEADRARAQHAGADAVLVKPCLPERLAVELQAVLSHVRKMQAHVAAPRSSVAPQSDRAETAACDSPARRRPMLSRAHIRHDTTEPPAAPPALVCPMCDQPLRYLKSHIGGVSARYPEQWDDFECLGGCGTFQYRQRTRKLRRVV